MSIFKDKVLLITGGTGSVMRFSVVSLTVIYEK